MSEIKHTPGPWRIDRHLGMIVGPDGGPISGEDNYKLAAAAPDLLEALRLCYDHCRLYHPEVEHNNVGEAVRAAIAKATGAQP